MSVLCGCWGCFCFCVPEGEGWVWTEKWHSCCPKQVETAPQTERRSVGRGRRQSSCKGVPGAGCTLLGEKSPAEESWAAGEYERNLGEQESSRGLPEPINLVSLLLSLFLVVWRACQQVNLWALATSHCRVALQGAQAWSCCGRLEGSAAPSVLPYLLPSVKPVRNHTEGRKVWLMHGCGCFVVDHLLLKFLNQLLGWAELEKCGQYCVQNSWMRFLWLSWVETLLQDLVGLEGQLGTMKSCLRFLRDWLRKQWSGE